MVGCDNSILSNLQVRAPDESPNTDGIGMSHTKNVQIKDSFIGTGIYIANS